MSTPSSSDRLPEGRPVEARSVEGRSVDGRPVEGRPVEGRSADGRSADGRSDRREQIVAAAAELFAARGAAATSMRDIGKACGILGGSLYHHFASKDELIDTLTRRAVVELDEAYTEALASSAEPLPRLRAIIDVSFRIIERHPAAIRLYLDDHNYLTSRPAFGYLAELTAEHQQLWLGIVRDGVRSGVFRTDVQAERFCRIARDTVWLTARWWSGRRDDPLEEVVHDITTLLLHGIVLP